MDRLRIYLSCRGKGQKPTGVQKSVILHKPGTLVISVRAAASMPCQVGFFYFAVLPIDRFALHVKKEKGLMERMRSEKGKRLLRRVEIIVVIIICIGMQTASAVILK